MSQISWKCRSFLVELQSWETTVDRNTFHCLISNKNLNVLISNFLKGFCWLSGFVGFSKITKKFILSINFTGLFILNYNIIATGKILQSDGRMGFFPSNRKGDWSRKQMLPIQKGRVGPYNFVNFQNTVEWVRLRVV